MDLGTGGRVVWSAGDSGGSVPLPSQVVPFPSGIRINPSIDEGFSRFVAKAPLVRREGGWGPGGPKTILGAFLRK